MKGLLVSTYTNVRTVCFVRLYYGFVLIPQMRDIEMTD